ncbi:MAG: hypothetical protein ACEQSB_00320 [Undibacterium sp.]
MTKLLDLDKVAPAVVMSLKLNGKTHKLKEIDVETFIENMKEIEQLSVGGSAVDEINMSIKIILRSFPTLTDKELRKLTLNQLTAISNYARSGGEDEAEKPAEGDTSGNAPEASSQPTT